MITSGLWFLCLSKIEQLLLARASVPGAGSMKNFTPSRVDLVLSSTLRALLDFVALKGAGGHGASLSARYFYVGPLPPCSNQRAHVYGETLRLRKRLD